MIDPQKPPKFPDPKPTVGLVAAEKQLLTHLGESMKLISEGGSKTREGMMEAIEAVVCFLHDRGVSGQQIWPFGYLRQELEAIFQGKRSLILQPGTRTRDDTGERHTGPAKQQIRICAAACSEAVYQLGCLDVDGFPSRVRKDADQFVARNTAKWRAFDKGQLTARTIKGWRDKLARDAKFKLLVRQFTGDDLGRRHLIEVLKGGPPHIGGF